MSALTDSLLERLQGGSGALRIGTLALFNDQVRFGGGFHTARDGVPAAGAGASDTVELPAEKVREHVADFLAPDGFGRVHEILLRHRSAVLAWPDGSGREAFAVNLLAEALALHVGGGRGGILRLGERDRPRGSVWNPPDKGCGYLLRLDGAEDASPGYDPTGFITPEWVEQTKTTLEAAGSYLVVITDPPRGALLGTAAHTDAIVTEAARVDPLAILLRRILGEGDDPGGERDLLARLEEAGALELLKRSPYPRVAMALAAAVHEGQELRGVVRRLGDPTSRVHRWFARQRFPERVGFALAAAVLNDARYLSVSDAAVSLHRLLTEDTQAPPALRFHEELDTVHSWISLSEPAAVGEAPRIGFREADVQQAVLAYAWNHLDGQRTALIRWLRGLVIHRDVEVQARACVAVAVMAAQDIDHALHRFLEDWAGGTSPNHRRAAATVLGVVSEDPDLSERVWHLLHTWADRPARAVERRLAATAALVAGGPPGRRAPDSAIEVLRTVLGEDGTWDSLPHVAEALSSLVVRDRTEHVLGALLDWSDPQDDSPLVTKSLMMFCYVAGAAVEPVDGAPGSRRSFTAPPPLLLLGADRHLRDLVELWKRALARKPVQEVALDVLRAWVGHVHRTPSARSGLVRILRGISAGGGRHDSRISYWLDRWSRSREREAATAAELLAAI
ncbi:hypothetical protein [Nocardiopsis sp. CC223A]|uniref:hypothetical protein n=1 Tax=Nocardiopsis sp. CC223A TaxID=3044051 RepID=UPI00278BCE14|nr:hypothetical protein [Nocardiopsis sp. CC223A]